MGSARRRINGRGGRPGLARLSEKPVGHEAARPVEIRSAGLAVYRPDRGAALPGHSDPQSRRSELRAGVEHALRARADRPARQMPEDRGDHRRLGPEERAASGEEEWNKEFFGSFFDYRELLWDDDDV